jgi:uncharacterized protein (TIGR03067 family)
MQGIARHGQEADGSFPRAGQVFGATGRHRPCVDHSGEPTIMIVTPFKRLQAFALLGIAALSLVALWSTSQARAGGDKNAAAADLKILQGGWTVSKLTMDDGTNLGDDVLKDIKMTFKDSKILMSMGGPMPVEIALKLDPSKKPKHIDVKFPDNDEQAYGIYEISGDTVRIAASKNKDSRPKDFLAKDAILIVLKRAAAEGKNAAGKIDPGKAKETPPLDKKNRLHPILFQDVTQPKSAAAGLNGTWVIEDGQKSGQPLPADTIGKVTATFDSGKLTVTLASDIKEGGPDVKKGTYSLNNQTDPRQIDIQMNGAKGLGIYRIDGDSLQICMVDEGMPRPTEFKSPAGSRNDYAVFKRAKMPAKRSSDLAVRGSFVSVQNPSQPPAGEKGKKSDADFIQGDWAVEDAIDDGNPLPAELRENVRFTVKGDKIDISLNGEVAFGGKFKLDSSKKPKTIDIDGPDGMTLVGIYEINGEKMRFCVVESGKQRPKEFSGDAGTGAKLVTLKRLAAEKKDEKKDGKKGARITSEVAFQDAKAKEAKSPTPPKETVDALDGTWKLVSGMHAGVKVPDEEVAKITLVVKGEIATIGPPGATKDGKMKIDSTKKPKQIDIDAGDVKIEGIYELAGDSFKVCFSRKGPRPTDFKSDANNENALMEFKRVAAPQDAKTQERQKDGDKKDEGKKIEKSDPKQDAVKAPAAAAQKDGDKVSEQKTPPKVLIDSDRFLGAWKLIKGRGNGEEVPPDLVVSVRLVFESDGKLLLQGVSGKDKGRFKIDSTPSPGHIQLLLEDKKETVDGIYKFDGNRLILCFPDLGQKSTDRPTQFSAEKGSKQVMFVLEQVQSAADIAREKIETGERSLRLRSANNLKQIALAFHSYHDAFTMMPAHAIYSKDGKTPLLSWRVAILPFIEQNQLYQQFKMDEPWDSEHNKKLIPLMPAIYEPLVVAPSKEMKKEAVKNAKTEGKTHYQVFTGPNTLFVGNKGKKLVEITDGTSNTILCVEATNPVIWTKPDDLVLPAKNEDKLPSLGGMFESGMNLAFCDGSVSFVRRDIAPMTLRALITPAGGEVVDRNDLEAKK